MILRKLEINFEDDGTLRGARAAYDKEGGGEAGVKRVLADDLATLLPDHAANLAQIESLTTERDALIAERDDLLTKVPEPPVKADTIENFRATAKMERADFVNAAADVGLLTDDEAIQAAMGIWPDSFNAALPADAAEARRAKVLWASTSTIHRNAPLIAAIIASPIPITEEQVDALFGWQNT
jgi:hypothetical protein